MFSGLNTESGKPHCPDTPFPFWHIKDDKNQLTVNLHRLFSSKMRQYFQPNQDVRILYCFQTFIEWPNTSLSVMQTYDGHPS